MKLFLWLNVVTQTPIRPLKGDFMNRLSKLICIALVFASPVFAQTYSCGVQSDDPSEDSWSADVNLTTGEVKLNSYQNIFGPNPFAILKPASSRGYVDGTFVFKGQNRYQKSNSYTVAFQKDGDSGIEAKEGRGQNPWFKGMTCVKVRK
jgi:hypothetical protein